MATTINSGYANSPKLTANIADHADVYGGRALVFDGVIDYLEFDQINQESSPNFTLSFWANVSQMPSGGYDSMIFGSGGSDYQGIAFTNTGVIYVRLRGTSGWAVDDATADVDLDNSLNTWNHYAVTVSPTSYQVYKNGELIKSTNSNLTLDTSHGFKRIGKGAQGFYNGKLSDLRFFNGVSATQAQIQELYIKPESMPSALKDYCVLWYPMVEGNPESPQSIVYDHSEKGLGSELITDNGFDDASYWNAGGNWSVSGSKATSGTGTYDILQPSSDYSLVSGKLYKFTASITLVSGSGNFKFFANDTDIALTLTSGTNTYTTYLTSDGAVPRIRMQGGSAKIEVDDFSVKEVRIGNHATTNFLGDENITSNVASDWTGYSGTPAGSVTNGSSTGEIYITAGSDTRGAYRSITGLTHGKTYKLTLDAYYSGTSDQIRVGVWNGSADTFTDYVNAGSYTSLTLTYTQVSTSVLIGNGIDQGNNLFIKNLSIKEVGVSSSGFETAVNEPVVPQVPLMKYNQKMIVPSDASTSTYALLPDGLTKGLTEITISLWFQKIKSGNSKVALFAVDGGGTYFRDTGNNRITCHMPFDNDENPFTNFPFPSDLAPHHYVFTVKSGSQQVYRDGVLVHSTSVTTTTMSDNIRRIGNYANDQDTSMADEFAIFNKHFTASEAQELFNDGVALDATTHSKKGNLLAYYRNDGVTTWQDRRGWSALDFDGNDDTVDIPHSSDYKPTTAITVASWYKPTDHSNWGKIICVPYASSGWSTPYFSYALSSTASTSGTPSFGIALDTGGNSGSATYRNIDAGIIMNLNRWYHIVGTFDGTYLRIYVDGVQTNSVAYTGIIDYPFNANTQIGGRGEYSTGEYTEGHIASVSVYNTAKSAPEILALFNAGINSSEASNSNLVGYWKLDNDTTVKDLSGNGNDGTVNGATLNDGNDGTVQGSPDSITIREGLNSNRDGLGFYFTNPSSNVLRLNSNQSEYIRVPNSSVFNFSGDFAIEFWMKHEGNATNQYICSMGEGNSSTNTRFSIYLDSNDQIKASYDDGSSVVIATYDTGSEGAVVDNLWHHWVVNFEKSDKIKIYLDGDSTAKAQSSSIASLGALNTSLDLIVGALYHGNGGFFNGLLDELRFYSKILSADEINKNYKHQKGKHKND